MQKTILCALALALSTTLAAAAEPNAMGKGAMGTDAMGDTTSMQATTPKPGGDSMSSDAKMKTDDKMGTTDSMKSDDKMMHDDKMSK